MDRVKHHEREALQRLLASAQEDSSVGLRISHFSLAWWSEDLHEGFRIKDAWNLSDAIRSDMATVFSAAVRVGCYPDLLRYREAFQNLAHAWLWRPTPIRPSM